MLEENAHYQLIIIDIGVIHSLCRHISWDILTPTSLYVDSLLSDAYLPQRAILDKISININKSYTRLISVLQGFQKCIA